MMTNKSDNFYQIAGVDFIDDPDNIKLMIKFNPNHKIFEGHFPGQPVVPGVCLIEIITDCVSGLANYPCKLIDSEYIKFLKPIIPNENDTYMINIILNKLSPEKIRVESSIFIYNEKFLKFRGMFAPL